MADLAIAVLAGGVAAVLFYVGVAFGRRQVHRNHFGMYYLLSAIHDNGQVPLSPGYDQQASELLDDYERWDLYERDGGWGERSWKHAEDIGELGLATLETLAGILLVAAAGLLVVAAVLAL